MPIEAGIHGGHHGGLIECAAEKSIDGGRDFRGAFDTITVADRQRRDAPDGKHPPRLLQLPGKNLA